MHSQPWCCRGAALPLPCCGISGGNPWLHTAKSGLGNHGLCQSENNCLHLSQVTLLHPLSKSWWCRSQWAWGVIWSEGLKPYAFVSLGQLQHSLGKGYSDTGERLVTVSIPRSSLRKNVFSAVSTAKGSYHWSFLLSYGSTLEILPCKSERRKIFPVVIGSCLFFLSSWTMLQTWLMVIHK